MKLLRLLLFMTAVIGMKIEENIPKESFLKRHKKKLIFGGVMIAGCAMYIQKTASATPNQIPLNSSDISVPYHTPDNLTLETIKNTITKAVPFCLYIVSDYYGRFVNDIKNYLNQKAPAETEKYEIQYTCRENLSKHLGGIQANNQFKIPAYIAIEYVDANRFVIDCSGEKIEIPNLFGQKREYKKAVLCLYDPSGHESTHGAGNKDDFKKQCQWLKAHSPKYTYFEIKPIKVYRIMIELMPNAVTMDIIYNGHGGKGFIMENPILSYEEFTKELVSLSSKCDNLNIYLNTCYGGGYWNTNYTTALQNIRRVCSSSKNGNTTSVGGNGMSSIDPPVFEKLVLLFTGVQESVIETYKTLQDLENIQGFNGAHSYGIFPFYGYGLPLSEIPRITDVNPYHWLLERYSAITQSKPVVSRMNVSRLDFVTAIIELGEGEYIGTWYLEHLVEIYPNDPKSQFLLDFIDIKYMGKKTKDEIEKARKVKVDVDPANFNKSEDVCGEHTLSILECREWAKKVSTEIIPMKVSPSSYLTPKGCLVDVDDADFVNFRREGCTKDNGVCSVYYNHGPTHMGNHYPNFVPVCKKRISESNNIQRLIKRFSTDNSILEN